MGTPGKRDGLLGKTREELEREKLEIELQTLNDRLQLERQKLQRDVRTWYYRILAAVISTLLGVGTFLLGQHFQKKYDTEQRQLEKIQEQTTEFSQVLSMLTSKDPSRRNTAADALSAYISTSAKGTTASDAEKQAIQNHAKLAISALAEQLLLDANLHNKEEYSRVLVSAARTTFAAKALADVLQTDRTSSVEFGRTAGDFVAARIPLRKGMDVETACSKALGSETGPVWQLEQVVAQAEMPFDSSTKATVPALFVIQDSGVRAHYEYQCDLSLGARAQSGLPNGPSKIRASRSAEIGLNPVSGSTQHLIEAARNLSVSSFTLVGIIQAMGSLPRGVNLESAAIADGNLDNLDMSGADLRWAYLDGSSANFTCRRCNLSYADLRNFTIMAGSLRDSTVTGAQFSAGFWSDVKAGGIDLTGVKGRTK